ncbi:autoinducer-2 kinase [Cellulosilyticum sp. I15G10I2]|uniref:autoinducer-2 kinase n=1 Tax=Cellulosilyticum sp. I15G10I2 TaxID=1892843 RepID=UPI00085BF042|nr:autoinducer-2 kinase [Cellulosilyticum sp. I15G10I2]
MSKQKYLMAIDAGTGSVRAVIFNTDGNQIGVSQQEWEHKEDPRFPGSMDFDWSYNWMLAASCIRQVLKETKIDAKDIAGISTTCMREGIVLYNAEGEEIWACANVDARSSGEVAELIQRSATLEKEIYNVSGQTYALGALPRLLWVKNKMPDIYEKTASISMFNDWLIYKLTGIMSTEPSNGCTTGIFDIKKRIWDTSIAEKCDIKTNIFPPVFESGSFIANVNPKAAEITGLFEGTPVIAGGGDAQLGCIGVGVVSPAQAAVFGGSFWQYEFNTDEVRTDPDCRVRVNAHAVPHIWQYEAIAFFPGLVMRWYRDGFCQLEMQKAKEDGKDPYYYMNREAEKIPAGSHGMMCTFSNIMDYICWKHASPTFTNFALDAEKFNRYTFYRAIMENAAMVTKGNMERVASLTGNTPSEIIFASGASKSPLWCQILADVLGVPVRVPKVKEATSLGAAILAGIGTGLFDTIDNAVAKIVHMEKTYYPDSKNHLLYNNLYQDWKEIYSAQLKLCDRKLTKNMWIAPGI